MQKFKEQRAKHRESAAAGEAAKEDNQVDEHHEEEDKPIEEAHEEEKEVEKHTEVALE